MPTYSTLDYLPDLTLTDRYNSRLLSFEQYSDSAGSDVRAKVYGLESYAALHSIYKFSAIEGATYNFASTSYYDPLALRVYDKDGNAIVTNSELDDILDVNVDGISYKLDYIYNWTAPYTGAYYVDASWNQGLFYTAYGLDILGDIDNKSKVDTTAPYPTSAKPLDGAFGVDVNTFLVLNFNEPVYAGSGKILISKDSTLIESIDIHNPNQITFNGNSLTIDPIDVLSYNSSYSISVSPGAVRDAAGNEWIGTNFNPYNFVTKDNKINGTDSNDKLFGTSNNDYIDGKAGNDNISGWAGNDILIGGAGDDLLTGNEGIDTVVFENSSNQYAISSTFLISAFYVTDKLANRDGMDWVSGIERLHFSDTNVALDITGTAGQAYRIYKAAFDRAPDPGGLGFWINAMDDGSSLTGVADGFISSPEFQKLFGANVSDIDYVTKLYNNVLDRNPDQGGYDFWLGALANGATRSDILVNFSESKENIANVADLIANGIQYQEWVG